MKLAVLLLILLLGSSLYKVDYSRDMTIDNGLILTISEDKRILIPVKQNMRLFKKVPLIYYKNNDLREQHPFNIESLSVISNHKDLKITPTCSITNIGKSYTNESYELVNDIISCKGFYKKKSVSFTLNTNPKYTKALFNFKINNDDIIESNNTHYITEILLGENEFDISYKRNIPFTKKNDIYKIPISKSLQKCAADDDYAVIRINSKNLTVESSNDESITLGCEGEGFQLLYKINQSIKEII
jgi:hypothetical protein